MHENSIRVRCSETPYVPLSILLEGGGSLEGVATPRQDPKAPLHSRRRIRAGIPPATRLLVLCAAAVAVHALATAADAQTTTTARLESPRLADISVGPAFIRDAQVPKLRGFLTQGSYWGGPYTVPTGETVVVYASNAYPQDPTLGQ